MEERRTRREIFKGWHGEESFWREVYARTVAGLFTALGIFLAAVGAGYVSIQPGNLARAAAVTLISGGFTTISILRGLLIFEVILEGIWHIPRRSGLGRMFITGYYVITFGIGYGLMLLVTDLVNP